MNRSVRSWAVAAGAAVALATMPGAIVTIAPAGLANADVRSALMTPVHDVTAAVAEALDRSGPGARLCVLPHGPLTVATPSAAATA